MDSNSPVTCSDDEELRTNYKLDLRYFTDAGFCPAMVRKRSRRAFELFLCISNQWLRAHRQAVTPTHVDLCRACGLDPRDSNSRSVISRLLKQLRETYKVIDFTPVRRKRPTITVRPPVENEDSVLPQHYVYFDEGWSAALRTIFDRLGGRAFSAEYMYLIAKYESALASRKQGRSYWFFPLERITETFHVSSQFASSGLRGLVELGMMHVCHGQFGITSPNGEFGAANRYYFDGCNAAIQRDDQLGRLEIEHGKQLAIARELAPTLMNGQTVQNVTGIFDLILEHGEIHVRNVIGGVSQTPPRSLKRRLPYVQKLASDR
tara:strand:+ start:30978 stop:31937 length:960 start_codon:yes stop_codon:yes gene_type:complete